MPSFHSTGALMPMQHVRRRPAGRFARSQREDELAIHRTVELRPERRERRRDVGDCGAARRTRARSRSARARGDTFTTPSVSTSGEYDADHVVERLNTVDERDAPGARELDLDDVPLGRSDDDALDRMLRARTFPPSPATTFIARTAETTGCRCARSTRCVR